MKPTLLLAFLLITSSQVRAQTRVDPAFFKLMPIEGSFSFTAVCYGSKEGSAEGSYSAGFWANDLDSLIVSMSGCYSGNKYDSVSSKWKGSVLTVVIQWQKYYPSWGLSISIDTLRKRIVSLSLGDGDEWCGGSFTLSNVPYTVAKTGQWQASAPFSTGSWSGYCSCGYGSAFMGSGFASLGGGPPPEIVSTSEPTHETDLSAMFVNDNLISFRIWSRTQAASLRIFDLLGRERDAIQIAAGSESLEYDASRLSPGMYLATLGGSAVKFIVR